MTRNRTEKWTNSIIPSLDHRAKQKYLKLIILRRSPSRPWYYTDWACPRGCIIKWFLRGSITSINQKFLPLVCLQRFCYFKYYRINFLLYYIQCEFPSIIHLLRLLKLSISKLSKCLSTLRSVKYLKCYCGIRYDYTIYIQSWFAPVYV